MSSLFLLLSLVAADPAAALDELTRDAERKLAEAVVTVMNKRLVSPSGDKHDLFGLAPYHWPNPDDPGGKAVFRDGRVNPEANTDAYDRVAYFRFTDAVLTLSAAYRHTRDERFAAGAARWLRAWLVDPQTRMNPNLNYCQCIVGESKGMPIGIIRGVALVQFTKCEAVLAESRHWSAEDRAAFRQWMAEYLTWLRESELGRAEARAVNNHGTWYDAQVAALALFTGDPELAKATVEGAKKNRIALQIQPDGRQPFEMLRTKSWDYAILNLEGLFTLANVGDAVGVDLWNYQTVDGRSLRKALDFLLPYASGAKKWSARQIVPFDPAALAPLLRRAARAYGEATYTPADETAQSLLIVAFD
ncbi:MAG: alginate lyase family protein [Pirellulales bacterium]